MIVVSERFTQALKHSHKIIVKADVLREGSVIKSDLDVISGSITSDSGAEIRNRVQVQIQDSDQNLIPEEALDLLWPNGNEISIRYGLIFGDEIEYVNLGIFRIARPRFLDSGDGLAIGVEGYDRSRTIRRNRFPEPYIVTSGTNYITAIRNLIQDRFPFDLDFSQMMETTRTTPRLFFEAQDNPWKVATDMASSLGAEIFFDNQGRVVVRPEPDPETDEAVWDYSEGSDCTMTELERDLDDERTYNHIVVTGESTSNVEPVRAETWDADPSSPTFVFGPYGRVTYFQASQYVTTFSQAQDAANAALRRVSGTVEQVSFNGVPNPLHEGGDILKIARNRLKIDARYVLDSFSFPLGVSGSMSGTTRQRRV